LQLSQEDFIGQSGRKLSIYLKLTRGMPELIRDPIQWTQRYLYAHKHFGIP